MVCGRSEQYGDYTDMEDELYNILLEKDKCENLKITKLNNSL